MSFKEWWYRMRMVYWYWKLLDYDVPLQFCFKSAFVVSTPDLEMHQFTPRETVQKDLNCLDN